MITLLNVCLVTVRLKWINYCKWGGLPALSVIGLFLLSTLLPTNVPSNIHLNMNKKIYSLKIEEQDHTQYYSLWAKLDPRESLSSLRLQPPQPGSCTLHGDLVWQLTWCPRTGFVAGFLPLEAFASTAYASDGYRMRLVHAKVDWHYTLFKNLKKYISLLKLWMTWFLGDCLPCF